MIEDEHIGPPLERLHDHIGELALTQDKAGIELGTQLQDFPFHRHPTGAGERSELLQGFATLFESVALEPDEEGAIAPTHGVGTGMTAEFLFQGVDKAPKIKTFTLIHPERGEEGPIISGRIFGNEMGQVKGGHTGSFVRRKYPHKIET